MSAQRRVPKSPALLLLLVGGLLVGAPGCEAECGDEADPGGECADADVGPQAEADCGCVECAACADAACPAEGEGEGEGEGEPDAGARAPDVAPHPWEACEDADEDGFLVGPGCPGRQDCDDSDPGVHPAATDGCNRRDDDCDGATDEDGEDCPPPCQPVMDCYTECYPENGEGCWRGCWLTSADAFCDDCYDAMMACGEGNGCFPGGEWDAACMDEHCPGGWDACFGSFETHGLCSEDYLPCSGACDAGDSACWSRCYMVSSWPCRDCLDDYSICMQEHACQDGGCIQEHCAAEYDLCFMGSEGPLACQDADGDGFGRYCDGPPDCDDGAADAHPGAAEICNGRDDDCDGAIDEKLPDCVVEREWGVLLYMAGDNDLSDSALLTLEGLAAAGGTDGRVGVALQVEVSGAHSSLAGDLPPAVYERTWRMVVPRMHTPDLETLLQRARSVGDEDITRPEALQDFLAWGAQALPARHYVLVLWDHGGGWTGILSDDGAQDFMSMPRVREGLTDAALRPDILVLSACEMGALEVLAEVQGLTDFVVASEDLASGSGLVHDRVLRRMLDDPEVGARDLAALHVEEFHAATVVTGMHSTWAAWDMTRAPALVDAVAALGASLAANVEPLQHRLERVVGRTQTMWVPEIKDLVDFVERLQGSGVEEVDGLAAEVARLATDPAFVVDSRVAPATNEYGHRDLQDAHGLSIYLPTPVQTRPERLEAYAELVVARGDGWDEFILAWLGDEPLARTEGRFSLDLSWALVEGAAGDPAAVDLDLVIIEPGGYAIPYLGPESPNGALSQDSLHSGAAAEWYRANDDIAAGTYYVFAQYPDTGAEAPAVVAELRFTDERFAANDVTMQRELGLAAPCFLGEGVLPSEVQNHLCSNFWFVGMLIRDDRRHTLVPGIYDDFGLGRGPRWLQAPSPPVAP